MIDAVAVSNGGSEISREMAARLLLIEASARVIKNQLNKQLRLQMGQLQLPLEVFFFFQFMTDLK